MLLALSVMTATMLWTPQYTRCSKNRQRGKNYKVLFTKIILFNQTQNSDSKLVRAKSHLNFFTKCLQKNVLSKKFRY